MAIAALVLGIVSIVLSLFTTWPGALVGIVGIILGALARKDPEKKGMATAGLILSIIGTILGIIVYVACAACIGASASMLSSLF